METFLTLISVKKGGSSIFDKIQIGGLLNIQIFGSDHTDHNSRTGFDIDRRLGPVSKRQKRKTMSSTFWRITSYFFLDLLPI